MIRAICPFHVWRESANVGTFYYIESTNVCTFFHTWNEPFARVKRFEIKNFLNKHNIENKSGKVTQLINQGLTDINRDYYKSAKTKLTQAEKLNENLRQLVLITDSINYDLQQKVDAVDIRIDGIKEKTIVIKEIHKERSEKAAKFTPNQVDSFFRDRYNY